MATAQRTGPRAVGGAPRRAEWQLKSALRNSISAAPLTLIFYIFFFTIIAGELFLYAQERLLLSHHITMICIEDNNNTIL